MKADIVGNKLWDKSWPNESLEKLGFCPVCRNTKKTAIYKELVDNTFCCAQGKWSMWRCNNCECAYLDPRPTNNSISMAYENYYTHSENTAKQIEYILLNPIRKIRRSLVNGYTNWRFSTSAEPANIFGPIVFLILSKYRHFLELEYRSLPRLPPGGGKLLDVGCGDGSFLNVARGCGWDVVGIDIDPKAISKAKKSGFCVFEGGIEVLNKAKSQFDVITMNHVIEHVHSPLDVLKTCYELLKPEGKLWIETPNIDSFGHRKFRENWRGLEAPRHLVIFNHQSLKQAILNAGFSAPVERRRPNPCSGMFKASYVIENNFSPNQNMDFPLILRWQIFKSTYLTKLFPSRSEFITVSTGKISYKDA